MMWNDPIVEEVRAVREAYAAKFDFDLQAIFKDIMLQQKLREEQGWKSVQPKHQRAQQSLTPND